MSIFPLYILVGLIFYVLTLYLYTVDNSIIILTIFALLINIKTEIDYKPTQGLVVVRLLYLI